MIGSAYKSPIDTRRAITRPWVQLVILITIMIGDSFDWHVPLFPTLKEQEIADNQLHDSTDKKAEAEAAAFRPDGRDVFLPTSIIGSTHESRIRIQESSRTAEWSTQIPYQLFYNPGTSRSNSNSNNGNNRNNSSHTYNNCIVYSPAAVPTFVCQKPPVYYSFDQFGINGINQMGTFGVFSPNQRPIISKTTATSTENETGNSPLTNTCTPQQVYQPEDVKENMNAEIQDPYCSHCSTFATSLWRRDERGRIMCNACALYRKLHGVDRPMHLNTGIVKRRNRMGGSSRKRQRRHRC